MLDWKKRLALELFLTAFTTLAIVVVMIPEWKWDLWIAKLQQMAQQNSRSIPELTAQQVRDIAAFRRQISEWNHESG